MKSWEMGNKVEKEKKERVNAVKDGVIATKAAVMMVVEERHTHWK